MSAVDNMARAGAPSAGVVLLEIVFGAVVGLSWLAISAFGWLCGAVGRLCVSWPGWSVAFAFSALAYSLCRYYVPDFYSVTPGIGAAMVACGGVSLRVAAQMAYVHRRKFAAAWQELTGPRPAIDAVPEPAVMPDPQPAAAMPEKEFEQVLAGNIGGRSHAR